MMHAVFVFVLKGRDKMAEFKGYLIKFVKTGKLFPHELIAKDTYKATPLQRTEIKAYRDNNNLLHRTTSPNHKTKLVFDTVELTLVQYRSLRGLLNAAFDNSQQRKLRVEYWDDEMLKYRTMTAYISDITYAVKTISSNDIDYSAISFTFVEY